MRDRVTVADPVVGPAEVLAADDVSLTVLNANGVKSSGHEFDLRGMVVNDPRALAFCPPATSRGRA